MKAIQAEGMKYIYFTKEEDLPGTTLSGLGVSAAPRLRLVWDKVKEQAFDDIRLVLFQFPIQPDMAHVRFLHWNDHSDLDGLDEKVINGTFTDDDFKYAVITVFGRTICADCEWESLTLVLFTAEEYAHLPHLEAQKIKQRAEGTGFKTCPNCGVRLRQMVVKIFPDSF